MHPNALPTPARAQRLVVLAATLAVSAAAWLWLMQESSPHPLLAAQCHTATGLASFLSVVLMWQAMSIAMMAPTTVQWLLTYAALTSRTEPGGALRAGLTFSAGYGSVWLAYSAVAATLQFILQHAGALTAEGRLPPLIGGLVLIAAGTAFFTPLSRACLQHCRNPMTYFLTHWDNGPRSGFRFGIAHAVYCVGCCWLLMLTGFAMGVMNLLWMVLLTVIVCLEKLAPKGDRIAALAAVSLMLWGAALSLGIAPAQP